MVIGGWFVCYFGDNTKHFMNSMHAYIWKYMNPGWFNVHLENVLFNYLVLFEKSSVICSMLNKHMGIIWYCVHKSYEGWKYASNMEIVLLLINVLHILYVLCEIVEMDSCSIPSMASVVSL